MKDYNSLNNVSVETTCRICLNNNAVKNIYAKKKSKSVLNVSCSVMISSLFSLSTNQDDGLPSKLCKKCYSKLISAYKLKLLAVQSFTRLCEHFAKNESQLYVDNIEKEEEKIFDNKDGVKEVEEIKKEIEDVLLVGTIIKDECIAEVLGISECGKDNIEPDDSADLSEGGGVLESDYDVEDDTPLVYYSVEEQRNLQTVTQVVDKKKDRKPRCRKKNQDRKEKKKRGRKPSLPSGPSICDLCGKIVVNIAAHTETHSENRKKYPCGDCPKIFASSGARRKHRNVNHLGKRYYCAICDKTYKRGYDHIRTKHTDRPKLYSCVLCDMRFTEQSKLNYHITCHTKERPYSCDVCGMTFRTKMNCVFHKRRVHDKEKPHKCNLCPRAFFSAHHLRVHIRSHTKEKIYKCPECDKSFSTSSGLSIHKKRHLGVKSYSCKICSSTFVCGGALRTHMISHTKERTHPCRYCGVKFGRTDHRNRHERTAHKDKHTSAV